uniref:HTH psq-type domain-containing protein n=1 Tax=Timema bartmani TaxID=61472 RepID=A0A7R9EW50_9NEOP|nr:unnamed protein product [Timema bartmani]
MSRKRTFLALMKKYKIIQKMDEKKITKTEIARWHDIPKSTLFMILKMREEIGHGRNHRQLEGRVTGVDEEAAVHVPPAAANAEDPDNPPPVDANSQPGPSMEPEPLPSIAPLSAPLTFTWLCDEETWQRLAPDCMYEEYIEYIAADDDITVWSTLNAADIIREQQESSDEKGEEEMEEEPEDIPTTKDVLKARDIYSRAFKCQGAREVLWSQFYNVKEFILFELCDISSHSAACVTSESDQMVDVTSTETTCPICKKMVSAESVDVHADSILYLKINPTRRCYVTHLGADLEVCLSSCWNLAKGDMAWPRGATGTEGIKMINTQGGTHSSRHTVCYSCICIYMKGKWKTTLNIAEWDSNTDLSIINSVIYSESDQDHAANEAGVMAASNCLGNASEWLDFVFGRAGCERLFTLILPAVGRSGSAKLSGRLLVCSVANWCQDSDLRKTKEGETEAVVAGETE